MASGGRCSFEGGAEEGAFAAWIEHLGEGAVVEDDAAVGREGDDAGGDGFDDGFELGAAAEKGGVDLGELGGGGFGVGAGLFEVGSHGVEAVDEVAELFGGGLLDAAGVVAGGDGFHGVGEGLYGTGDLLGGVEGEPAAGEEGEEGDEGEEAGVEGADLAALAEDDPVGLRGLAEADVHLGYVLREGQADDDEAAVAEGGGGEGVIGSGEAGECALIAFGGVEDGAGCGGCGEVGGGPGRLARCRGGGRRRWRRCRGRGWRSRPAA